jgi:hypothetical protein
LPRLAPFLPLTKNALCSEFSARTTSEGKETHTKSRLPLSSGGQYGQTVQTLLPSTTACLPCERMRTMLGATAMHHNKHTTTTPHTFRGCYHSRPQQTSLISCRCQHIVANPTATPPQRIAMAKLHAPHRPSPTNTPSTSTTNTAIKITQSYTPQISHQSRSSSQILAPCATHCRFRAPGCIHLPTLSLAPLEKPRLNSQSTLPFNNHPKQTTLRDPALGENAQGFVTSLLGVHQ